MGISIRTWVSYGIITWNQSLDSNRPASAFFKKYKNSKSEDAKMHSNDPLPQRREVWGMAGLTASCSHQEEYVIKSNWYSPAVHGSEILRSPVEVGNFPHDIQGSIHSSCCDFFYQHQEVVKEMCSSSSLVPALHDYTLQVQVCQREAMKTSFPTRWAPTSYINGLTLKALNRWHYKWVTGVV